MFSSKSFIVSGLIFRSLIPFEFILVYSVRKCSFTCGCPVFLAPLIEEAVFSPLYSLAIQAYQKMGRRSKQTILQRRHTDGQKAHEKMFNITHH